MINPDEIEKAVKKVGAIELAELAGCSHMTIYRAREGQMPQSKAICKGLADAVRRVLVGEVTSDAR